MKLISISLSPNTEKDDVILALKLIFQPWKWKKGKAIENLEKEFKKYLGVEYAISFNSGRSSLMAILYALELEKGSEVFLQAFTCNAVPNPIIWASLKPVYIDCEENTFNIDINDLARKFELSKKSNDASTSKNILLVQHTFGTPADMAELLKFSKKNDLILIEDCAHSLGAEYKGQKVGTFGKASFFSFSRDKIISSVYGGITITNDPSLAEKILQAQDKFGYPSYFWILQQLLHPVLMNWIILPIYSIFGKYLLVFLQWTKILSKAVHWKEKKGKLPSYFPKRLPDALAILALNQFKKLEKLNKHRDKIASLYQKELKGTEFEPQQNSKDAKQVFLRFILKHPKAHEIIKRAWVENILIGDWYTTAIAPHDTQMYKIQYLPGSCPVAEKLAKITLNLPTHINISEKEAKKIIYFLKQF